MRKIKFLVAALLLCAVVVSANPVPVNTAQTVAANFYSHTYNSAASNLTLAYTENASNGQPVYYVFNINNEGGFVIVSAEDAGFPIIGISNTGHYVIPSSNNNVSFWMGKRKAEVLAMRANNVKATPEVTTEWNKYVNNTEKSTHNITATVNPLLGTIMWDQSPYYNAMCPGGSITGCVATAMAQIMKYWSFPSVGTDSTCYYDETMYGFQKNYGELCAKFDTSHYAWSAMPNSVTSTNKEVAKLMYDCGVSVNMDYSPSGSGAQVVGAYPSAEYSYPHYFQYDIHTINSALQKKYTTSAWVSLIENEINNKRPVQYEGTDTALNEGHSWVCDGYSGSLLHMNWGWSGFDDGNYTATSLAPVSSGYNFDGDLGAVIGIQPTPTAIAQITENISITVYPNPSHGEFTFEIPDNLANSEIRIYNMLGQEVGSDKVIAGNNQINLGNQPKGVYLFRLLNDNGQPVSTGKLVIE